jgi:hypothetical protein
LYKKEEKMASLKPSWGSRADPSLVAGIALCALLGLLAGAGTNKATAAGPSSKCLTVTAAALFRDDPTDGIRSDNLGLYPEYRGWEDSLVCLMTTQDFDFILGTTNTKYEKTGIDRQVTLDFGANPNPPTPFPALQVGEVSIRADYILSSTGYDSEPKRLILWFKVGRTDYKLYFDGVDECDTTIVSQTGTAPDRVWTIECDGKGRLEGPVGRGKTGTIGLFLMPFKITISETTYPPTCL